LLAVMLLAALILTACGSSSNNGENPVKASGVLRVGTEGVYSPFSYHDPATGQLVGYDVDVAHAVADKLGLKVEFVETPWDAIFAALEANRFDVVANEVTINDERKQKYDLSEPYSVGEGVIVTRADDNSVKSLDDIKGKVAGETATSNWAQVARDQGGTGRVRGGLHPGDQAAQPGPGGPGDQRQHRGVCLPRRDRGQVGQDRREHR
jgi:ABC-type amino acid transport substrate-binding protein